MTEIHAVVPTWFLWMVVTCMAIYLAGVVLEIVLFCLKMYLTRESRKVDKEIKTMMDKFIRPKD